jgi:hypothetical protein
MRHRDLLLISAHSYWMGKDKQARLFGEEGTAQEEAFW